jgi:hypothetical protein
VKHGKDQAAKGKSLVLDRFVRDLRLAGAVCVSSRSNCTGSVGTVQYTVHVLNELKLRNTQLSRRSTKMRLYIHDDKKAVGIWTAQYIASRINAFKPSADKMFVLGLPTGGGYCGDGCLLPDRLTMTCIYRQHASTRL